MLELLKAYTHSYDFRRGNPPEFGQTFTSIKEMSECTGRTNFLVKTDASLSNVCNECSVRKMRNQTQLKRFQKIDTADWPFKR